MKRGLWRWSLLALAVCCAACGGDSDEGGAAGNGSGGGSQQPEEPPVVGTEVWQASPAGAGTCSDTCLTLKFASTPVLGTTGAIRIHTADGKEVDRIDLADVAAVAGGVPRLEKTSRFTTAMDAIGTPAAGRYRIVHCNPVRVAGNTVVIKPHHGKLACDATYYVTVEAEAIRAEGFRGIGAGEWSFTTRSAPASRTSVTVGGPGCDFCTVQAALDYACECGDSQPVTIHIRNGRYEELLFMRNNNNVILRGESREGTVICCDNCDNYASGVGASVSSVPALGAEIGASGGRAVMLVENCDMLRFENLTLENTHGPGNQAEALYNNDNRGVGRLVFVGCNILGAQDTLNLKGYGWFYDCLVAGDVDFIWGSPRTVLFEACEIRSVNGGYIVQARCLEPADRGFVFLDCDLTEAAGSNGRDLYLARSSGAGNYFDNVTFARCRVGGHVAKQGWYEKPQPNPSAATAASGWKEYGLTRNGTAFASSSPCSRKLAADEAEPYLNRTALFASCPKGTEWLE